MKKSLLYAGVFAHLYLASCFHSEREAGKPGVDETSNGFAVQFFVQDGSKARNAKIYRVSCDFDASVDTIYTTDSLGRVFLDTSDWNGKLCLDIRGDSVAERIMVDRDDHSQLDSVVLSKWVRVSGIVDLPPNQTHAWVEIFGVHGRVKTRQGGSFVWDSLPSSIDKMRAMLIDTPLVISTVHLELTPGSAVDVDFEEVLQERDAWKKEFHIVLNTGSSGADLKEDLLNFPVYLWLDSSNFPIGAAAGGADIRIEKESGRALPFEIQYWDAQARVARIWVLLDTLHKNDSLQRLQMRWSNPYAIAVSSSEEVFDSANGWVGVWHLSESYRDSLNRYRVPDASSWKNDGVGYGYLNWMDSPTGTAVQFDESLNMIAFDGGKIDFGRDSFTWELWMLASEMSAQIFHKGRIDSLWERGEKQIFLGVPNKPYVNSLGWNPTFMGRRTAEDNIYVSCSTLVVPDTWVHLTLRRTVGKSDSGIAEWFINGKQVGNSSPMDLMEPDSSGDSMFLGIDIPDNVRIFAGGLSEFRIAKVARDAEWIRMDHFQQEPKNRSWIKIQP